VRTATQASGAALAAGDIQPRHQIDTGFRLNSQTPQKPIDVIPIVPPIIGIKKPDATPVPEPGTLLLVISGIAMVGM
jgi:hypothetical protein